MKLTDEQSLFMYFIGKRPSVSPEEIKQFGFRSVTINALLRKRLVQEKRTNGKLIGWEKA